MAKVPCLPAMKVRVRRLFIVCAALPIEIFAAPVYAAAVPLELIYGMPQLWEEDIPVAVAPDGSRVAYVVRQLPERATLAGRDRWQVNGAPKSALGAQVQVADARTGKGHQVCDNGGYTWRPAWSPDSQTLAFYSDAGGAVRLWVYEVRSGRCRQVGKAVLKPKLWAGDEAKWSPDGTTLFVPLLPEGREVGYEYHEQRAERADKPQTDLTLYTSGSETPPAQDGSVRQDPGLNAQHLIRENNSAIAAVDVSSGRTTVLVPAATEPRPAVMRVSPSGRWVSYLSVWKRGSAIDDSRTRQSLAVVRSDGGPVKVVTGGLAHSERDYFRLSYAWHPARDSLIYLREGGLYRVDFDDGGPGPARRLGSGLGELAAGVHWFTRDGSAVVVGISPDRVRVSALNDAAPTGLAVIPFDGGPVRRIDFDVERWEYVSLVKANARTAWQPDANSLSVMLRDAASGELVMTRVNIPDGVTHELWRGRARIGGLVAAADGRDLFGSYEDIATPLDVFRFPADFSGKQRLSHIAPALDATPPPTIKVFTTRVPMHDHSFLQVRTAVLLPADFRPGKAPPAIVTFYPDSDASAQIDSFGGGNRAGVPALVFTSRGYAVLYPHVKIGPGGNAGNIVDEMLDSMLPQIYRAVQKGYADIGRLALQGNSFGGYATVAIVTQTNLFRAAVPSNGPYDLVSGAYSHAPFGSIAWTENRQPRLGTHLWAAPLKYIAASPVFQADKINTPILIMQGGDDGFRDQAEELFVALKRLDKPAQLAIYADGGHWIAAWPRKQAIAGTQRILEFYERHLGAP